jgi:hypothetical protein
MAGLLEKGVKVNMAVERATIGPGSGILSRVLTRISAQAFSPFGPTDKRKALAFARASKFECGDNLLVVQQLARFILYTSDSVLQLAFSLVGLAFGFRLGVARYLADAFLDLAFDVLASAFNAILVHLAAPSVAEDNRGRAGLFLDYPVNRVPVPAALHCEHSDEPRSVRSVIVPSRCDQAN